MKNYLNCGLFVIMLLVWVVPSGMATSGTEIHTLLHDDLEREFIIYTPASINKELVPVVLVLHGGGGDASAIRRQTRFDVVAEEGGFLAVYPNGVNNAWNDGRTDLQRESDDVGFISALIDLLIADFNADPEKIFVTGLSNGGFMSFRMACELSNRISGIASVAATLSVQLVDMCEPDAPVGVLIMNGTDDPIVPYDGGKVTLVDITRGAIWSTDATISFWATHNQCIDTPTEVQLRDRAPFDGTHVFVTAYTACQAPVSLYRVEGGGHTWPGRRQNLPFELIGRVSRDINASEVIWSFFASLQPTV